MIEFSYEHNVLEVRKLCSESIEILKNSNSEHINKLIQDFNSFYTNATKESKLTISFIGQYNAGKSSLIVGLTNAPFVRRDKEFIDNEEKLVDVYQIQNKEIKVGPQVLTDKTEIYEWNDVLIIDTPGVYAGKKDHDEKTFEQISKSDLIVFVVPNELFNEDGGNFFRKVAYEMKRDKQILLVVNKMAKETGVKEHLVNSLSLVTEPNHPEYFNICFVDALNYIESFKEEDQDDKKRLLKKSNFEGFHKSLDILIHENKLTAKIVTPLHKIASILEESRNFLSATNNNEKNLLEIGRRRKIIIRNLKTKLHNLLIDSINDLIHDIKIKGETIVSLIDGDNSQKDVEKSLIEFQDNFLPSEIKNFVIKTEKIIENYKQDIFEEFKNKIQESSLLESFFNDIILELGGLALYFPDINLSHKFNQEKIFDLNIVVDKLKEFENTLEEYKNQKETEVSIKAKEISNIANKVLKQAAIGIAFSVAPEILIPLNVANEATNIDVGNLSLNKAKSPITDVTTKSGAAVTKLSNNTQSIKAITDYASKAYINHTLKNANILEKVSYKISENLYLKISGVGKELQILSKLGPALSVLGVALEIYSQYRQTKQENDHEEKLREAKNDLRKQISDISKELRNSYLNLTSEYLKIYDDEVSNTNIIENDIISSEKRNDTFLNNINNQLSKVRLEIESILK